VDSDIVLRPLHFIMPLFTQRLCKGCKHIPSTDVLKWCKDRIFVSYSWESPKMRTLKLGKFYIIYIGYWLGPQR